ncbi:MAG: dihydrolipoyl dehydrogenase [Nanoarchaeota archaeon]
MVVGSLTVDVDVAVIGAGPGGYVAAIRLAQLGKNVALVEQEKELGGICLNHGCIPTKALIHASNFFAAIKDLEAVGIHVKEYSVDMPKMKAWKDGILAKLNSGIKTLCDKYGIEVLEGKGVFKSSTELRIEGKSDINTIRFKNAVIATGSLPIELPAFPFSHPKIMDSSKALQLDEIPKRLAVVGGGYVGTEMGTVYAKLGSEVHIIERAPRLLSTLDAELALLCAKKLQELGITIHTNTLVEGIVDKDGKTFVRVEVEGKEQLMETDKVFVVVGRRPNSQDLGLENTKVKLDGKGFIVVDKSMRTTDPAIFAIGDVVGQPMLAHKASREAKVAAEVISGLPAAFDNKVIPYVVFNDPEIASVGMTEDEAKAKGHDIVVGKFPFSALGRALTLNHTEGFVKWVAEKSTGVILGMHCIGPGASDIVSEATLAIEMGATLEDVALTIHPHPTLPESLMEAAEVTLGKGIHIFSPMKKG